jgi:ribosomal-protein-alanine N-acetyltransferase
MARFTTGTTQLGEHGRSGYVMSATLSASDLRLRPMVPADLNAISRIEKRAYTAPWSKGVFKDCLNVGHCCQVLEHQGQVVAYGIISVGAGEAHLLNLCVAPDWQGHGLARRLLGHLLALATVYGAQSLFLEVRPSNSVARELYQSSGFCEVGIRHRYYPASNGREDALIMAIELS